MINTLSKWKANKSRENILIVGVGNRLLGDEGVGLHIIDNLLQIPMPPYVNIIDCGCDLLNLMPYLNKPYKIIIIDAIRAGKKPGEIYKFDYSELEITEVKIYSAHQVGVIDSLGLLKQICPSLANSEIILIGIEPKVIEPSADLSKEVKESIPDVTKLILDNVWIQNNKLTLMLKLSDGFIRSGQKERRRDESKTTKLSII